jgi:hypothetical protein
MPKGEAGAHGIEGKEDMNNSMEVAMDLDMAPKNDEKLHIAEVTKVTLGDTKMTAIPSWRKRRQNTPHYDALMKSLTEMQGERLKSGAKANNEENRARCTASCNSRYNRTPSGDREVGNPKIPGSAMKSTLTKVFSPASKLGKQGRMKQKHQCTLKSGLLKPATSEVDSLEASTIVWPSLLTKAVANRVPDQEDRKDGRGNVTG